MQSSSYYVKIPNNVKKKISNEQMEQYYSFTFRKVIFISQHYLLMSSHKTIVPIIFHNHKRDFE